MKKSLGISVIATSLLVSACSGGGGGSAGGSTSAPKEASAPSASSDSISGTAAVGAPLGLASVTIKGATGACNTNPISGTTNSLGVYNISVPLTCGAPYLITVSGSTASLQTIAPSSGVIANVTPLTELIAKRAAGSKDLSASFVNVDLADLQARESEIKTVLKKVAAGIGAAPTEAEFESMDLLSGSFSANGSGIDKLLDVLDVDDTGTDFDLSVGSISLAIPVSNASPMPDAPLQAAVDSATSTLLSKLENLDGARTFAKEFTKIFASSIPSSANFNNFVSSDFKHSGMNRDTFYSEVINDSEVVGLQFRNVVILKDDPADFWVAFQVFGIEDGKYFLWSTWTSKVENPESDNPKLLGNTMDFGLEPTFIKLSVLKEDNSAASNSKLRAFYINSPEESFTASISKFNNTTLSTAIAIKDRLLDHTVSASYSQRNITGLASQYIKLNQSEADQPIVKVTYTYKGGSSKDAYIPAPYSQSEVSNLYMDFTLPPFDVSNRCAWNLSTLEEFEGYDLLGEDWDFNYLDMIIVNNQDYSKFSVMNPVSSESEFPGNLSGMLTNFSLNNIGVTTADLGVVNVVQSGPGGIYYNHLYMCDSY